ncbi:hypothetical protein LY474_13435 [Myxococcus stipitatus]|uniref:hypothetical protein n=1 Tax=Myxococcus stipitatus TaxID=83455 RepID=UPI001F1DABC3|nr:hypothetical protein [Myxococcus stipitatus]MCE9668821.1 hypothetical protein [Myxococcus stipitatus]
MPLSFRVRVRNRLSQPACLVLEPWCRVCTLEPGGVTDIEVEGPEKNEVVNGKSVRGDGGFFPVELDAQSLVLWGWGRSNLDFVTPPVPPSVTVPPKPVSRFNLRLENARKTPARMLFEPGARVVLFKAEASEGRRVNVREILDIEVRISGAQRESSIPVMELDLDEQGLVVRMNESLCSVEHFGDVTKH